MEMEMEMEMEINENSVVYWVDEGNEIHGGVVVSPGINAEDGRICRVRDFQDEYGIANWMDTDSLHPSSEEAFRELTARLLKQKETVDCMVANGTDTLIGQIHRSQVDKCHRTVFDKDMCDIKDRLLQRTRICAERITAIDDARGYMDRFPNEKKPGFDERASALLKVYRPVCAVINGLFAESKSLKIEE